MTSDHSTDRDEAAPTDIAPSHASTDVTPAESSTEARTADRAAVTRRAGEFVRSEDFFELLAARVARRTESQAAGNGAAAHAYLAEEIVPELTALAFATTIHDNPESDEHPLLIASRIEDPSLPTVLLYGHGDVQFAHDSQWADGLDPWVLTRDGDRLYGRGSADNKGQHTVNSLALKTVLESLDTGTGAGAGTGDGGLGYNVKILMETAEEAGSLGLKSFAADHRAALAADLFLASDGPRIAAEHPTLFLGSRGALNFRLVVHDREGDHHSGNWGGKLRNCATVLASAINCLVDGNGVIRIPALRPEDPPASVLTAVAKLPDVVEEGSPEVDPDWGEPGFTSAEKVFAFNVIEVLALKAGNPDQVVNAIPGAAEAHMQLRFVVGTDIDDFENTVRTHLEAQGIHGVDVVFEHCMPATRLDPNARVVAAAAESIRTTTGLEAAIEPNLGGTIPNDVFAEVLGLPTVWVPHSYPGCNQHAPDEHALYSILEQGAEIMAGMFWDLRQNPDDWFTSKETSPGRN
ncbi:Acetylornithine deacetylase/Succinyl-diaminopimelate desuccinylase [Brevibacterium sandarakinum]|uniref:Acetylornithine deacetylase/Succinyl-diaminopimelate desuccinylase n=1 Tax=Brevibacterium sandarakinum TaxID=629680 RepID=A0A1H1R210_BRESA|nr:M20/M25/M40 family metallo-hydrolase [Brevibacterium sandarakinum]SDS29722.1 Acetylornithine deacetylase/Succinyl-diaminopimelate desuccinylase [Brevibacterium sandarakinum]